MTGCILKDMLNAKLPTVEFLANRIVGAALASVVIDAGVAGVGPLKVVAGGIPAPLLNPYTVQFVGVDAAAVIPVSCRGLWP